MLYIRVDMNNVIATGHVMRCIAIADAAKRLKVETTFILADDNAKQLLQNKGYRTIVLYSNWEQLDGELEILRNIIAQEGIESLLVDTYQVTSHYLHVLSKYVDVYYLDDLNAFEYPVRNIICYANYWDKMNYSDTVILEGVKVKRNLLLGCDYAPLRAEFQDMKEKKINKISNVMILSGGTDNHNIIERFLNSLDKNRFRNIIAICGRYYDHYDELVKKYENYKNIKLFQAVDNLIEYMENSDLVISAGGTTLYELSAVGTPTISYSFADNQLDNCKRFHDDGIIAYAGDVRNDNIFENVNEIINKQYDSLEVRSKRSRMMQRLVDGYGATRIVEAIIK